MPLKELERTREKLNAVLDFAGDAIFMIDAEFNLIEVSESASRLLNYSIEELKNLKMYDLLPREDKELFMERARFVDENGGSVHERKMVRKDGSLIETEVNVRSVNGGGYITVMRDMSERKKLRERDEEFRVVFEDSAIAVSLLGTNGVIQKCNPALCKMLGYSESELSSEKFSYFTHPEDIELGNELFQSIIRNEISHYQIEKRYIHKEGHIVWGHVTVSLVRDQNGAIRYVVGMVEDITEQKKIESELIERESQLTSFFENIEGAAILMDSDKRLVLFNNQFVEFFRFNTGKEPYIGQLINDLFHESILQERLSVIDKVLKGNKEFIEVDYVRNGKRICYRTTLNPVIVDEKITGICAFTIDLTKDKETENIIRENQEKYRNIFENSVEGIYRTSAEGKCLMANPAMAKIFGYNSAQEYIDAIDNAAVQAWATPQDRTDYIELLQKNGIIKGFERQVKQKDGTLVWISMDAKIFRDKDGKYIYSEGFVVDINERKKAEEKILASEEKFRLSFMTSPDAFYIGTVEEGLIHDVNEGFTNIYGYTREEAIGKTTQELNLIAIHEERAQLIADLKIEGRLKNRELICRKKNGELMVTSITLNIMEVNKQQLLLAVIRDITESKRAAQQLVESEERFREVLENSVSASFKRNLEKNIYEYLSPVFTKIVGYTQEEMKTMPLEKVLQLMHPDDIDKVSSDIAKALDKSSPRENKIEYRFKHKTTGLYRWLRDEFVVMRDADGNGIAFIGSVSDITEQKLIAQELSENKEQLSLFIEHSPASLAMFDTKMRYIATSRRWMNDYNLGGQDIIGKTHYEVFPEIGLEWKDIHQRCLKGAVERREEDSFRRLDGTVDWMRWEIRPWRRSGGEIGGIIMFTEVISDRKKAELKLEQSEERNRALIDNISDTIILVNARLEVVYQSPSFVRTAGFTLEDHQGRTVMDVMHPEEEALCYKVLEEAKLNPATPIPFQLRTLHKLGHFIWVEGTVTNLLHNESVKAFVLNYRDITERKNSEEILETQNIKLRKTNAELDRFVYSVSHDLRAPLSSMLGLISLLDADEENDMQKERIGMMQHSVEKLDNFIEDILHYSRNARMTVEKDEIDFSDMMKDVKGSHKFMEGVAGLDFQVKIEQNEKFISDKRRVSIILNNLISNALKYRDESKANQYVNIKITTDKNNAIIEVEDNGIGISENDRTKIFEMFYRGSKQSTGSGLGLYIVKETIEALEASIYVSSEKYLGSTFTVKIPNLLKP